MAQWYSMLLQCPLLVNLVISQLELHLWNDTPSCTSPQVTNRWGVSASLVVQAPHQVVATTRHSSGGLYMFKQCNAIFYIVI